MGLYPYVSLEAHIPKECLIRMPTQSNLPPILTKLKWKHPKFNFSLNIVELGAVRGYHPAFNKRIYHIKDILIAFKDPVDVYYLMRGPWTGPDLSLITVERTTETPFSGKVIKLLEPETLAAIEKLRNDFNYPLSFKWVYHIGSSLEMTQRIIYSQLSRLKSRYLVSEMEEVEEFLLSYLPNLVVDDIMKYYWMRGYDLSFYRLEKHKPEKTGLLLLKN